MSNHRCEGAAWLSSARAVRCRLKCHNERNPYLQLLTGHAEDSGETAVVRCEEGGDDVKSARPLRPGLHTCYNGGYRRQLPGDRMLIPKASLSSDRSLQPDFVKLDSLVIAHQPRCRAIGYVSRGWVGLPRSYLSHNSFFTKIYLSVRSTSLKPHFKNSFMDELSIAISS